MGNVSENDIKEQLSIAYVQAVVTKAGCTFASWNLDRESIDISVRAGVMFPTVHLQLKATPKPNWVGDNLAFPLPRKNYIELSSSKRIDPAYLVVLVMPENYNDWCCIGSNELMLKHCVYWLSLEGFPPIGEAALSRTVHLPKTQLFNDGVLQTWFNKHRAKIKP